jgi:hypothetical protein
MRFKGFFWLVIFSVLAVSAPQFVWAQAVVNENLETATLYVDANKGSDSNPGTQTEPFKTISAASAAANTNNDHGIGTRIVISPGIYRETVTLMGNQYNTAAPVTFQGSGAGVVVSGAVQYTDWSPYSGNSAIYTASWPNQWGYCEANPDDTSPFEQPIVLRREMIFVNGIHLTQVLSYGQMQPGTFSVNETSGRVYVWPPAGTDMSTANVEVATLPQVLHVVNRSNVVFRGMSFAYAASCRDNTAVYVAGNSQNLLFDNDTFRWNNAVGLHFFSPVANFTVQSSSANHNGQSGMMSVETKYGLWQSVTTSFNNWRGAQGAYYVWNSGGIHFFSDHDQTISGMITANNQTHGIHFDTDNANITATNVLAAQNLAIGTAVEKSEGPIAISNSHFCSNNLGLKQNYLFQGGLALRNSELVTLANNTFYNNETSQIIVIGQKGGIEITNWETGVTKNLISQNFTHTGNTLVAVGSSQQVFSDSYLGGTDWTLFQTTLNSNKNTWWNSAVNTAFEVPISQTHPLSGWQTTTGQDANSSWGQPSNPGSGCSVATYNDYWLLVDNPSQTLSDAGNAVFTVSMLPFGALTGTANLTVDGVKEVPGLSSSLSANSVPLNGMATLQVNAANGAAPGSYPITVIANSGSVTRTVTATLVVPATSVRLSAVALIFANQKRSTSSPAQSLTLTNYGKSAMRIYSITSKNTDYTESNNCGSSLAAGSTCTVKVTFTPIAKGTRPGNITITDGDPNSPQVVSLTGVGD